MLIAFIQGVNKVGGDLELPHPFLHLVNKPYIYWEIIFCMNTGKYVSSITKFPLIIIIIIITLLLLLKDQGLCQHDLIKFLVPVHNIMLTRHIIES